MKQEEFYLMFDGNLDREFSLFCPFILPWTTKYQSIMLISLLDKQTLRLNDIINTQGHKLNQHAIDAFTDEINACYEDIMKLKAGIEN